MQITNDIDSQSWVSSGNIISENIFVISERQSDNKQCGANKNKLCFINSKNTQKNTGHLQCPLQTGHSTETRIKEHH